MIRTAQGLAILLWSADLKSPERLATPFVMAQAAMALEQSVELYFTAASVQLLTEAAGHLRVGFGRDIKPLEDYLRETQALGAQLYACSQALHAAGLSRDDLTALCTGLGGSVQFMSRSCDPNWRALVF